MGVNGCSPPQLTLWSTNCCPNAGSNWIWGSACSSEEASLTVWGYCTDCWYSGRVPPAWVARVNRAIERREVHERTAVAQ